MNTEVNFIKKITEKEEKKKSLLLDAYNNNVKISDFNIGNKYESFEFWEYSKSKRLLYEISLSPSKTYMRFPRGSIIKVDFGVNVGSEFSGQHFAITLSKKDSMYKNTVIVIPLTSKKHSNVELGSLISEAYMHSLQKQFDKLNSDLGKIDIKNCEFNKNFGKEIKNIEKILNYYKGIKDNLSYACIGHIRTVSKLNILPPINKYDIVGNFKCSKEILQLIDQEIIKKYTSVDYIEYEKILNYKVDKEN